jgi:hypothetical protein
VNPVDPVAPVAPAGPTSPPLNIFVPTLEAH